MVISFVLEFEVSEIALRHQRKIQNCPHRRFLNGAGVIKSGTVRAGESLGNCIVPHVLGIVGAFYKSGKLSPANERAALLDVDLVSLHGFPILIDRIREIDKTLVFVGTAIDHFASWHHSLLAGITRLFRFSLATSLVAS
ncbi:MAG: hypothetical protein KGL39_17035 [Patescibacteria group bacterium]|nr:hypothetical protein [Patescibacteria group bacterium]